MGVIGNMDTFQQYQMGQAMTAAAENPAGGGASDGMGLGMGFAMASRMMPGQGGVAPGTPVAGGAAPPPRQEPAVETFKRDKAKVGRNEPCPCGSGKKFKQCHGKLG